MCQFYTKAVFHMDEFVPLLFNLLHIQNQKNESRTHGSVYNSVIVRQFRLNCNDIQKSLPEQCIVEINFESFRLFLFSFSSISCIGQSTLTGKIVDLINRQSWKVVSLE